MKIQTQLSTFLIDRNLHVQNLDFCAYLSCFYNQHVLLQLVVQNLYGLRSTSEMHNFGMARQPESTRNKRKLSAR
jgi:hypothetical protein